MNKTDYIGGRGEAIAFVELSKIRPDGDNPYFWPHYLGEKGQTVDYLVELVDAGLKTLFFFAQIKTTTKDFTKSQTPPRLRVEVKEADVRRMAAWPAPTYVIGVHYETKKAFIVSIHGDMHEAISSITTRHELTPETLRMLWEEVQSFWSARDMTRPTSLFLNEVQS